MAPKKGGGKAGSSVGKGKVGGDESDKQSAPRVSFCPDPTLCGGRFTPTYESNQLGLFASLDAGDPNFKVGPPGKTLNGQFGTDLQAANQRLEAYRPFHEHLFATAEKGMLVMADEMTLALNPNLAAGFVRKCGDNKTETAFIEIFKPQYCVHRNQMNAALVYAVGPQRKQCSSDDEFLASVRHTVENIGRACGEYNSLKAGEAEIQTLRIPLISGGVYAGKCPKDHVALAILQGLFASWSQNSPEFNFAYDEDVFRKVFQRGGFENDTQMTKGKGTGIKQMGGPDDLAQPSGVLLPTPGKVPSVLNEHEKELLKVAKKLRDIRKLEDKMANGEALDKTQADKVSTRDDLQKQVMTVAAMLPKETELFRKNPDMFALLPEDLQRTFECKP